jgi:hypothetical protein
MLGKVWETLLEYLRRTPYWSRIEPWTLAAFLYVGVVVCAYQYVQWRYGVTLSVPLFLRSYLFKQTTIGYLAVLASWIVLTQGIKAERARLSLRITVIVLILATALFALQRLAPQASVSSIRLMFAGQDALVAPDSIGAATAPAPSLNREATIYLVFVLNRLQRAWHFEIDFRRVQWDGLPQSAEQRCQQDDRPSLCFARAYLARQRAEDPGFPPLVLVSADPLGPVPDRDLFWLHEGGASVISTYDWRDYTAPGLYEYLVYTLIVQGVLTHLDTHCGGAAAVRPAGDRDVIYGNVFEYYPRRDAFKAAILSGYLGVDDEARLLNCFGPEYLDTTARLLKLDWLRSDPVKSDLEKVYGVKLGGAAP